MQKDLLDEDLPLADEWDEIELVSDGIPVGVEAWKQLGFAELQDKIHQWAVWKGFFDGTEKNIPELLMLIVSELGEALEHYRSRNMGAGLDEYYEVEKDGKFKPDGFAVEIADVVIRCFDLAGYLGMDLHDIVARKMEFNRTRPHKHGKVC